MKQATAIETALSTLRVFTFCSLFRSNHVEVLGHVIEGSEDAAGK